MTSTTNAPSDLIDASLPALPAGVEVVVARAEDNGRVTAHDVELTLHDPQATVGDLAAALGFEGHRALVIDDALAPAGAPVWASGLRRGSVISAGETGRVTETETAGETGRAGETEAVSETGRPDATGRFAAPGSRRVIATLRTVSGPDAGRHVALGSGAFVVGGAPEVDVRLEDAAVARRHALLEISADGAAAITDLAPRRPSRLDGEPINGTTSFAPGQLLLAGTTGLELCAAAGETETVSAGDLVRQAVLRPGPTPPVTWTRPWHRPPRGVARPPVPPVPVPAPTPPPSDVVPVGLAAVVATLVTGGLVALLLHQPAFLLLGAVGAIGTVGAAVWQKARHRSRWRAAAGSSRDALVRFRRDLGAHQAAVAERLRTNTLELVDAVAAAQHGTGALWARRPGDDTPFSVVVGRGDRFLPPALAGSEMTPAATGVLRPRGDDELWALIEAASVLHDVPVILDLGPGSVVGIVGPEPMASALTRSLVLQLVAGFGPAHLRVAGLVAPLEAAWLRWLPHAVEPSSGDSLVARPSQALELLGLLDPFGGGSRAAGAAPHLLLVVDDPMLLAACNAPARRLLARAEGSIATLVIAEASADLPAICTTIVEVSADGSASIHRPGSTELAERTMSAGASLATARAAALAMAALHDPEQPSLAAALPGEVELATLLGPAMVDPKRLQARWSAAGSDPAPRALLGLAAHGPVEVDLVRDGPHALIAGTTGSGKSELLRSLVAALAAGSGPDQLSFILIDYKGGSAFDACARLPHVVGMVTDLDEQLGERALRSLHAEVRRRERILRDAGVPDLATYRAQPGAARLPRLVVVVDEFATLAADLPDFIASLVGVAQRGRSLGVHLILATQRPSGAVSDDIRANTNLRIALRVLDGTDSTDVIGEPVAASLPRHRPGRAVLRLGPGELVAVQVAAVTVPLVATGGPAITSRSIGESPGPIADQRADGPTALDAFVRTAVAAAAATRVGAAPRPWLPPLPRSVDRSSLPPGAAGLVDDPDHQTQGPWHWERSRGHLLCIGALGSGVTSSLAAVMLAAAATTSSDDLHVYVLHGGSALAALEELPHVGASIGPSDDERQARLVRLLGAAMARRSRIAGEDGGAGAGERQPAIVLVVDQLAAWRTSTSERLGPDLADLLDRILIDGPALGIVVAGGLDRPGALPLAVCGAVGERLLFRLADAGDALGVGVRPAAVSGLERGRAVVAGSGLVVQMGHVHDLPREVREVGAGWVSTTGGPAPVVAVPAMVRVAELPCPSGAARPWVLPIGLGDDEVRPVPLLLHAEDHLLVAGPARSGKSSALLLLAHQIRRACPAARLVGIAPRRSALSSSELFEVVYPSADAFSCSADGRDARDAPLIVLVDDAELVDDPDHALAGLLGGSLDAQVIAAGRVEALRAAYGHWTQIVRRQRRGLLLRPQRDLDGDVLGVVLPRREAIPAAPGRGYLVVDGTYTLVQLACTGSIETG